MPINPINTLLTNPRATAADQVAATAIGAAATNAAAATGTTNTNFTTFAATLGQLLGQLGPTQLDLALAPVGNGNNTGAAGAAGFTNTILDLVLLSQLGQGQVASQPGLQQTVLTQLLIGSTGANDPFGLGLVSNNFLVNALIQQGVSGNLFTQLNNVSTQPNPIVFSSAALAQAFQIGNGTGTPA